MTTNLDHCLFHCEGYAVEAVDKRAAMAKAGGYCPVYLYPGHAAEACKNATNPKSVCSMKGCQKHHHPSLHGFKDKYVTSVNILMATAMCDEDTKDIPAWQGFIGVTEFEPDVNRAYLEVNFTEDGSSELYNTLGKKDVDKRMRELSEAKKALQKHRIEGERVLMVVQTVAGLHATRTQAHRESNTEIPRPDAARPPRWSDKLQPS